jgi:hypothetical protein
MLIAYAWFGGVSTAVGLIHRGWYCITNVKTHTKHVCKKELWKDALGCMRNGDRNDGANRELILNITGMHTTLHGAFHHGQGPDDPPRHHWNLLGTNGWSKEAPPVTPSLRLRCDGMTLQAPITRLPCSQDKMKYIVGT